IYGQQRAGARDGPLGRARGAGAHRRVEDAGTPAGPVDQGADATDLPRHRSHAASQRRGAGRRRVVETSVRWPRTWLAPAIALLAVGILAAMVMSGRVRENRQLVRTSALGVMSESPVEIDRVELQGATGRWPFVRAPGGWRLAADGGPVAASLALHLDDSIKFMHVSAPVRVMEREEWAPIGL